MQHREHLVLAPRASHDEVRSPRHAPARRARALVRLPRVFEHPGSQELRERLGVVTVGLLLGARDRLQLPRVDDLDRFLVRADPRDRQCVAGRLQHNPIIRAQLLGELLDRTWPRAHPRPVRHSSRRADGDLAACRRHRDARIRRTERPDLVTGAQLLPLELAQARPSPACCAVTNAATISASLIGPPRS